MCGILFQYFAEPYKGNDLLIEFSEYPIPEGFGQLNEIQDKSDTFSNIIPLIHSRGPDFACLKVTKRFRVFSSVLSLRAPFTKQPIVFEDGKENELLIQFNGELYNTDINGNDTVYFSDKVKELGVVEAVKNLEGEFAYVINDVKAGKVYFGRDSIGKRSLVYKIDDEGLMIASLTGKSQGEGFSDCLAGVVYEYDCETTSITETDFKEHYVICSSIDEEFKNESDRINSLDQVLRDAVNSRIHNIQPLHEEYKDIASFAVLFSGGLDCTVIAALAAELSTSGTIIDLLNVGFDNPRTGLKATEAPDRLLAIKSSHELNKIYNPKGITFQLKQIDVPFDEYSDIKSKVMELMWPKNTEMDLSIAIAFYFASRQDPKNLHKPKVLLSGLGADELYGGYHKLNNKSQEELAIELTRQINNIYERNLQRDDKVIADNGVEVRYPFLCEHVVKYSTESIEINYKISKYILRKYALLKLGLEWVWEEPKRAIQFGAKSAKMTATSGRTKGTDELK